MSRQKQTDALNLEAEHNICTDGQLKAITNFDLIINSSMDGLWIADNEGKILQINQVVEKLHDIAEEQVKNKNVKELIEHGLFDKSIILEVIRNKKSVMVIHKLQNGRQLLRIGNPIFDEEGELSLVTVTDRDMTELYLLRSDLEKSNALSNEYRAELEQLYTKNGLWSKANIRSEIMFKVLDKAVKVSQVDTTVLVRGESGVGKGYFANLIHNASDRKDKPFIRVDCGSIPEQLIEAELFGYEGGAFTGAREKGKPGYFEMAEGGTLFLDEIGELPSNIQVKLLRFLENSELIRVGDTVVRIINTRVIAATNRDLEEMVREGTFRKDLFFRLNVIPLNIPPLRDRHDDIPALIYFFLKLFNKKYSKDKAIFPEALECLCSYSFPGNIREISNLIERMVVLSPHDKIDLEDLPAYIRMEQPNRNHCNPTQGWNLPEALANLEKDIISRAMKTFGSQRKAAVPLGIDQSTLARKIKKHGILG